jgi:hypothetical protein
VPDTLVQSTDRFVVHAGDETGAVIGVTTSAWGTEHNCAIAMDITLDPAPVPPIVTIVDPDACMRPGSCWQWGPLDLRQSVSATGWDISLVRQMG